MKNFTFYWRDGKRQVLKGSSALSALNAANVARSELDNLQFYEEGDCKDYTWSKDLGKWAAVNVLTRLGEVPA